MVWECFTLFDFLGKFVIIIIEMQMAADRRLAQEHLKSL